MSTSSGKTAEKENKAAKTETPPNDTTANGKSTGDRNEPNSSASKRPLGFSQNSTTGPSDVKKPAPSTAPKDEDSRVLYVKYDKLPEEWLEPEWWTKPPYDATQPMLTFHKTFDGVNLLGEKTKKEKASTPVQIKSSNEYVQFIQALQNFVHQLDEFDTNKFEGLVRHVDFIAKKLQDEKKNKALNLYEVGMDTYMYKTFCSMKPYQICKGDAVYVRHFFESFKVSIAAHFLGDDRTKRDMTEILNTHITPLRMYGEKMVIPCHLIVKHFTDFASRLMEEYPKI